MAHEFGRFFGRVRFARLAQPNEFNEVQAAFAQFQTPDKTVLALELCRQLPLRQPGLLSQSDNRFANALILAGINGFVHARILRALSACFQNASRHNFMVIWLVIFAAFTLFAIALGFLLGRWFIPRQNIGESLVANTIESGFKRPHLLLNNVTLQIDSGTSQIDHILIADTGIFVIETKHYSGWIFGSPGDRQWTQVIYRKKSRFQNPIHQNYGHIKALQSLFNLSADSFCSIVVFTGDAEFRTALGGPVMRLYELTGHLAADRPVLFDERQMTYIVGRIEMKRLRRSIETDEYHINRIRRRAKAFEA